MQKRVYVAKKGEQIISYSSLTEFAEANGFDYKQIRNAQQTIQIKTGKRFPFEIAGWEVDKGVWKAVLVQQL